MGSVLYEYVVIGDVLLPVGSERMGSDANRGASAMGSDA